MSATKIEWCDEVFNPLVGCSKCSPGCDNCYAERRAAMLARNPNPQIEAKYAGVVDANGKWTGKLNFQLGWFHDAAQRLQGKPRKSIFIGSMTDIFYQPPKENWRFVPLPGQGMFPGRDYSKEDVYPQADFFFDLVAGWDIITGLGHEVIFLTKRPDQMRLILHGIGMCAPFDTVHGYGNCVDRMQKNTILMTTVCNQDEANEKIPQLLAIPGKWKRGVSIEPMLGPVDFHLNGPVGQTLHALTGDYSENPTAHLSALGAPELDLGIRLRATVSSLNWVICGGETGPGARPMHPGWVRSLRDQCVAASVPFFFKGWGAWIPAQMHSNGKFGTWHNGIFLDGFVDTEDLSVNMCRFKGKASGHRLLDGREWNEEPV
jgi:protein gp37